MKKLYFTFSIFLIIISSSVFSQETININKGVSISVDGVISPGEWEDANNVEIISAGDKIVKVLFKHDGENMLFAFLDNLASAEWRFPEIFFDVNNDKSTNWFYDDWWFHVSST